MVPEQRSSGTATATGANVWDSAARQYAGLWPVGTASVVWTVSETCPPGLGVDGSVDMISALPPVCSMHTLPTGVGRHIA
ncbi:hypothetical protein SY2F82_19800 [Streptomyces sp. Y2F8-2]|nr:hypothetical protein SY2F82_19800 [Streptomyces sp. Y2F8-2]